jgi:hypothetical protein
VLVDKGVPSILYEGGSAGVFEEDAVRTGLRGALNVMRRLVMLPGEPKPPAHQIELEEAHWVRTSTTGLLEPFVRPGDILSKGDLIARNVSIFGDHREEIVADMREVSQIRVGHFPHWFATRSDGKVMFLSLWYSDAVAAIDIASHRVLANIQFARLSGPKRILVAPKRGA